MISNKKDHLSWSHPLIREWFLNKFDAPTEPQQQGWPSILAGKNTLISAPTGSGKTLAAFLSCIDQLVRKSLAGNLNNETEIIYVSPLKALGNDIHKNLLQPLNEIIKLAKAKHLAMEEIRVAVRTGDTLASERQAMLKKPPHILITTPESLYMLLTAEKSRLMLKNVTTFIMDEIHALANNKRGTHLSLSIERLKALTLKPLLRIGLSATQKPLQLIANFLAGSHHKATIINIGHAKHLELAVEVPMSKLGAVISNKMWDEIYDRITALANQNRSTLVFVNTRRLAERIAHHLAERLGEHQVIAHHGSLSRKLRLAAETKLKQGEIKLLVATASLELGIDIGSVDLVCQIGSPRAIAIALQRVGRAGHWQGAISKGHFFVTTRDELLECAALIYAIYSGDLDQLILPQQPIDILAQQIIAICATGEWIENDLFKLVKKAYPYKNLSRETFNSVLEMLAEGIAGSRGRYGAYLFRDQVNNRVSARRGSRLVAITSGGAIPETGLFTVILEPQGIMVGTLDEDFAIESNAGDIILLGTASWKIIRIESATGKVFVVDAHGAAPSVPFWRGEAPARTNELSLHVSHLRQKLSDMLPKNSSVENHKIPVKTSAWLKTHCKLNDSGAIQLIEYILQGRAILGAVPTQKTIIAERFFDEAGGMQLIIHAPFGARINKAWGLALRKRFCRSFNFELQAAATDDGLNISLTEQHSFPLGDVFHFLNPKSIKKVLTQAVIPSPIFASRWRFDATRSLALVRFRNGKKVPPFLLRILADDLLAAVFPDAAACQDNLGGRDIELPDHPLINETMKDVLHEALDIDGLTTVLGNIQNGSIQCLAVDTPLASPFAHEILNANPYAFLDDAPLEERRARAVEMRRILPSIALKEIGKLDPQAILEVQQQAWPDIRNIDELHDALQTFIAFPKKFSLTPQQQPSPSWQVFFDELVATKRADIALFNNKFFWVAREKTKIFNLIFPDAIFQNNFSEIINSPLLLEREDAIANMVRGWMLHIGPITDSEISNLLEINPLEINQAFLKLETSGFILRGNFRNLGNQAIEWCERRLLARIHRLTLDKLRQEIEPVSAKLFVQWLLKWQHLTPESQLKGEIGLFEIIKQLQGFEIPAKAWEQQIFAKRIVDYNPDLLDRLCMTGEIGWGRLSCHPAIQTDNVQPNTKRIMPTSIAPITFFIRENGAWMLNPMITDENQANLSNTAKIIYSYLKQKGASFLADIVRGVSKLQSEVETGLWELVTLGMLTADSFDNLRALIDPRRRLKKKYRHGRFQYSAGRWYILQTEEFTEKDQQLEAICWVLLKRYGVVFRDLLVREKNIPRWRELLMIFRRLEDRGEIRGGRFVEGFFGEQFALPFAIDSLRANRQQQALQQTITLSAVDPLNLIGIILPGERITAISGKKAIISFQ